VYKIFFVNFCKGHNFVSGLRVLKPKTLKTLKP